MRVLGTVTAGHGSVIAAHKRTITFLVTVSEYVRGCVKHELHDRRARNAVSLPSRLLFVKTSIPFFKHVVWLVKSTGTFLRRITLGAHMSISSERRFGSVRGPGRRHVVYD